MSGPASPGSLIFVYNADSGIFSGLKDLWHKTVSPQTYDCQLCAVTYGPLGMNREWRDFVRALDRDVRFLHRDELRDQHGVTDIPLPAAFEVQPDGALREWLSAPEMRSAATLEDLMGLVQAAGTVRPATRPGEGA